MKLVCLIMDDGSNSLNFLDVCIKYVIFGFTRQVIKVGFQAFNGLPF